MKRILLTINIFSSVLVILEVKAQCPSCDIALQSDTRNYFQTELKTDFKSILKEIFKHDWSYYKSGEWKRNTNFQSGGSYGVISGFLDGSKTDESNEQTFNSMKTSFSQTQDVSNSIYQKVSQSFQSLEVYKKWVECIKECPSFDAPILTQTISGKDLTVTLYWQHNNTNDKQIIRDITFGNLISTEGGSLIINQTVKGRNSYSKKFKIINVHEPSYVTVTMSEYPPVSLIVPAVPVENLASNYPVGTIIASVLDWKRFCELNGQPETLNYTNKLYCKWVPADGRSVIGSTYGEVENLVPDLRGVFLRGVNDFGVPGVQNVNPDQAETDDKGNVVKRPANNFESDEFRSHWHEVKGSGGGDPAGGWALENVGRVGNASTTSKGGAETRPKNVTVYYYIKIN